MSNEVKHGSANGHGSYERQDLRPSGILYFLLGLGLATLFCVLLLRGAFTILDRREKARPACRESAGHQRSGGHAPRRAGISAECVSQPQTGRRRTRPVGRHSNERRSNPLQLRMVRRESRNGAHPD